MTFTGMMAEKPEGMSLKAQLGWKYFFDGGWAATTAGDIWIITDEGCDLSYAQVFPDAESFVDWLESVVDDHLESDRLDFLRSFCSIPELVDDRVAEEMMRVIDPGLEEAIEKICGKCKKGDCSECGVPDLRP